MTNADKHLISCFIGKSEFSTIASAIRGEEGEWFQNKLNELLAMFKTMPKVYEQDGLGKKAVAYLHYFNPRHDWYITERDISDEQLQAFGMTDDGELGYISIAELIKNGVELDLYWKPKPLAECEKD